MATVQNNGKQLIYYKHHFADNYMKLYHFVTILSLAMNITR